MSDETLEDFVSYLTTAFGPNSPKPPSPEDLPQYKSLVRPFSPKAMNIAYVEYDFGRRNGMGPWSAVEDKDGMIWIPYYGRGNAVVRLDPKTAELTQFPLPAPQMTRRHPLGGPGARRHRLVHRSGDRPDRAVEPATKEITEYQNSPLPDGKRHHRAYHSRRRGRTGVGERRSGDLHVRSRRRAVPAFRSRRHLRQRGRQERRPVVHLVPRRRPDRARHQGRRAVEILSADQGQAAAPRGRRRRHRLVHRAARQQDRPPRSEDRHLQGIPAARAGGEPLRHRHRSQSA